MLDAHPALVLAVSDALLHLAYTMTSAPFRRLKDCAYRRGLGEEAGVVGTVSFGDQIGLEEMIVNL